MCSFLFGSQNAHFRCIYKSSHLLSLISLVMCEEGMKVWTNCFVDCLAVNASKIPANLSQPANKWNWRELRLLEIMLAHFWVCHTQGGSYTTLAERPSIRCATNLSAKYSSSVSRMSPCSWRAAKPAVGWLFCVHSAGFC